MIGHRVIMEESMPRPRPPCLQREVTRHGTVVWYVRIGKGPRVRIKAQFGTPEFDAEYQNAVTGKPRVPTTKTAPVGSLAWLLAGYREVPDWTHLSLATRRQRENIFSHVLAQAGHVPANKITQASIVAGLERRSETPAASAQFPRCHARPVQVGGEAGPRQDRSDRGRPNADAQNRTRFCDVDRRANGRL